MRVHDPNLPSLASTDLARTQQAGRAGQAGGTNPSANNGVSSPDDVQISDLAQTLQTLGADSTDRQARIDQLARDYGNGTYKVDPQAIASKVIDDATK